MVRCGQDQLVDSVNDGTAQNREDIGEATLGINKRLWTASYIRMYVHLYTSQAIICAYLSTTQYMVLVWKNCC